MSSLQLYFSRLILWFPLELVRCHDFCHKIPEVVSSLCKSVLDEPFLIVSGLFPRSEIFSCNEIFYSLFFLLDICRVFCIYCVSVRHPLVENSLSFQSSCKCTSVGTVFYISFWQRNFLNNSNKFCPSFRRLVAAIKYEKRKVIMRISSEDVEQVTITIGFGLKSQIAPINSENQNFNQLLPSCNSDWVFTLHLRRNIFNRSFLKRWRLEHLAVILSRAKGCTLLKYRMIGTENNLKLVKR